MAPTFVRRIMFLAALISLVTARANAQMGPSPQCPSEQKNEFAFLVGQWVGTVYDLKTDRPGAPPTDSVPGVTARTTARVLFSGCALSEQWHFEDHGVVEVETEILRAFDATSGTWAYDLVTSRLEHVRFEGRRMGDRWVFEHNLPGAGGPLVRLWWVPTAFGYSEQISRSADGGRTWTETRHINFKRATD